MPTTTVSPKFQVVIPKEIRETLQIKPGEKFQVLAFNNRVELIPVKPIEEMRGFLKGANVINHKEGEQ